MNLLSLPDEMLASVFKYSSSADLSKIRKISSKVDDVARRYGLDKYKIRKFEINLLDDKVLANFSYDTSNVSLEHHSKSLLDLLLYYFPKIRGIKELGLFHVSLSEEVFLSDDVGELLLGNCCKNVSSLKIQDSLLRINFMLMKRIFTKLPLRSLRIFDCQDKVAECSDKLIEGLELDALQLNAGGFRSLDSLSNLCDRRVPRELFAGTYKTTLSELGKFFEKYFKDGLDPTQSWTIYFEIEETTAKQLRNYFTKLKCFQNCKIKVKQEMESIMLVVSLQKVKSLNFMFPTECFALALDFCYK